MTSPNITVVINILLAVITSGVMVRLLTIRQDRRKIAGEATAQEANAASVLSGAALKMVESAELRSSKAEQRAQIATDGQDMLWKQVNEQQWEIYELKIREQILEAAIRAAGVPVPIIPVIKRVSSAPPPELERPEK